MTPHVRKDIRRNKLKGGSPRKENLMKLQSKLVGLGMAALMSAGLLAAPAMASAQRYRSRTHNEDTARTNAIALGAAGILLSANHQSTLGTIALGAAAYEAIQTQNAIKARHDREARYGYRYNDRYYNGGRYSNSGYYNNGGYYNSNDNCNSGYRNNSAYNDGGYYDQLGMYHKPGYDAGYYSRSGQYNQRVINGRDNDGDRDDYRSGRDWAATRGRKRGWDHNGKRD